jgi:hypothetical protein
MWFALSAGFVVFHVFSAHLIDTDSGPRQGPKQKDSMTRTANVLPRTDERSLEGGYPIAEIIPLGMHGFHPVGN